ncbi:MAG: VanZ family protein [Sphingomonadales bacterium]|nr:MAG: VanZ family protein [Sphingomonadales bacterium]
MLARIAAVAAIAIVIALTLGPVSVRAMSPVNPLWDRALAYSVIGFLLILSFPRHPLRVVLAVLLMIVGLEVAQELRPDRHGRLVDVIEKSVGAGIGFAAAAGTLWALRRPGRPKLPRADR